MNISLTPQLEEMVNRKIESGLYTSASEVIREALRLLNEHDRIKDAEIKDMRAKVLSGVAQIREGKIEPFDADKIKAKGRKLQKKAGRK